VARKIEVPAPLYYYWRASVNLAMSVDDLGLRNTHVRFDRRCPRTSEAVGGTLFRRGGGERSSLDVDEKRALLLVFMIAMIERI
jgi:hypothetical protein